MYKTVKENGSVEYYGYCIDLLRRISEILDFSYDIYDTELYGAMADDGSWNGLIQELISKVGHFQQCPSSNSYNEKYCV